MILDDQNTLSDSQVPTTTAISTNVVDQFPFGGIPTANLTRDVATGNPLWIYSVVRISFAGGTSLAVQLESDDNTSLTSATVHFTSAAVVTASLVAGFEFKFQMPPGNYERYIGVRYVIVGTMSGGGAISTYITPNIEQIRYYRDARPDTVT